MALDDALDAEIESIFSDENLDAVEATETAPELTRDAAAPETEAPVSDRGDGRDSQGRFVKANAEDVSQQGEAAKAEAPKESPTADAQAGEQPPVAATDPTAAATEAKAPEAPAAGEPLLIPFNGRQLQFPGAVKSPDGIFIQADQEQLLVTSLGKAAKLDDEREVIKAEKFQAKQERLQARQERELFQAKIGPAYQEIEHIFGLGRAIRQARTEEESTGAATAMLEYVLRFVDQEPLIRERMTIEEEKAQLRFEREANQPDPAEQREQVLSQVGEVVARHRAEAASHPKYKLLTEQDYQMADQWVSNDPESFLYRVGSNPQLDRIALANGSQPGQIIFRDDKYFTLLDQAAVMRADFQKALETERKVREKQAQVAAENARRLAGAQPPSAPPARPNVPAKAQTNGEASKKRNPTRQEVLDEFEQDLVAVLND